MVFIFRRVLGKTLTNQVFACDVLFHLQVFHQPWQTAQVGVLGSPKVWVVTKP